MFCFLSSIDHFSTVQIKPNMFLFFFPKLNLEIVKNVTFPLCLVKVDDTRCAL